MIFGKNAGLMLKYQKAKAKMVEYDVSKQEYPHFPLNSNELSYPTTYVLSRYSECIIENNHDELKELELLLITTAEYYDSAFKSKDRPEYDWDFLLSGASAYFLRKDFGSAKVLAARVVDLIDEERSPQKLLTNIYNYLLGGVYLPYLRVIDTYERINNFFLDYFGKGKSLEASVRPLCLHSVTSSIHSSKERPGARLLLIMKPPNVVNFYLLSRGV